MQQTQQGKFESRSIHNKGSLLHNKGRTKHTTHTTTALGRDAARCFRLPLPPLTRKAQLECGVDGEDEDGTVEMTVEMTMAKLTVEMTVKMKTAKLTVDMTVKMKTAKLTLGRLP